MRVQPEPHRTPPCPERTASLRSKTVPLPALPPSFGGQGGSRARPTSVSEMTSIGHWRRDSDINYGTLNKRRVSLRVASRRALTTRFACCLGYCHVADSHVRGISSPCRRTTRPTSRSTRDRRHRHSAAAERINPTTWYLPVKATEPRRASQPAEKCWLSRFGCRSVRWPVSHAGRSGEDRRGGVRDDLGSDCAGASRQVYGPYRDGVGAGCQTQEYGPAAARYGQHDVAVDPDLEPVDQRARRAQTPTTAGTYSTTVTATDTASATGPAI